MAVSYTAVVDVDGEGRNGGHVRSSDGEFSLSAILSPVLGGADQATAQELAEAAHQICPYSKATRGNIPVTINASAA
ncbi:hypothetical protein ABZT06_46205 [Streptomyces sp. NPDC005483]|uniref:hypothetical protein n=1 Tax=Streptomyces sp. NPDC005483 TaxID=3154882 RepID=UPI0033A75B3C